jgi:hypothetical protein
MKRGLIMSYMDTHAAFAPAGGIQELSDYEISWVAGGHVRAPEWSPLLDRAATNEGGFWQGIGQLMDNPWTTVGKFLDVLAKAQHKKGFTYEANGIKNIK